ncbi:MAG: alanine--tRNA ligase [Actinobacteria bacterium]|nr:alanine--tRNA ligase [Actinomycetota bacterium]
MNSNDIRNSFLTFFESKGHKIIPSSSLIPHDNSLLFTAAGMVPLKDFFLGNKAPESPNMVSSQKCIRTIDIDIIGDTDRHLSFFEMLGNFSVGKYFKEEAIKYSYEFITEVLNVDKDKLWFTVYKNDDEAYEIWRDVIGIPENRIQRGEEDNFWHMNIPGPCGPCSEIFIDRGKKYGKDGGPIGGGEDRFIEIWNLVFMESIQDEPFQIVNELPDKNIDTGMGLERISMILQNKENLFDTDLFQPLYNELIKNTDNSDEKYEKIIIDHIKSSTFMISDGVVPTNEGRGYVLRRLIRRAIRAYNQLNNTSSSLDYLIEIVIDIYKDSYPELQSNKDKIIKLFKKEEKVFQQTLNKGIQELNSMIDTNKTVTSKDAFYLFETFGFPFELTKEISKENDVDIDENEFHKLYDEHKMKSKSNKNKDSDMITFDVDMNEFVGYDVTKSVTKIYHIEKINSKFIIFPEKNPFYYEAGGQISDKGIIRIEDNIIDVLDVYQADNGATGLVIDKDIISIDQEIELEIDKSFRSGVSKSHTGAHIVHAALRKVLGDHVAQAGSNVTPGKFRFDFSHTEKVSATELDEIFNLSNETIFKDFEVNTNIMDIEDAKKQGALAFFGDKYDDDVRVVNIGDFSKELCGGTHVHNSHDVGLIVLLQESSIGSNLRRVEMLSGKLAYEFLFKAYKSYKSVSDILNVSIDDVPARLKSQLETLETYQDKFKNLRGQEIATLVNDIESKAENIKKKHVYIDEVNLDSANELRDLAIKIVNDTRVDIAILYANINGKNSVIGATKKDIKLNISSVITEVSKLYGGGASKDENLSIGGGPDKYDSSEALIFARELVIKEI